MSRLSKESEPTLHPKLNESRYNFGAQVVGPVTAGPNRRKKSEEIQKKILDAAEYLFSRWGYAGVATRDVTNMAEMRMANISYYFKTKQNLYNEVLRRRAEPLARMRIERLLAVRNGPLEGEEKLAAIIDAYADPPLELSKSGDPGWKNFFALIGQVTFSGLASQEIAAFFNEPARVLMGALYDLYPTVSAAKVQAASILLIGPYIMVLAETGRIETFPEAAYSSGDLDYLGPIMKKFIVGGIRAVLGPPKKADRERGDAKAHAAATPDLRDQPHPAPRDSHSRQ